MRQSIRVACDDDVAVVAGLRRLWSEENSGAPIDDPEFEAAFREWWREERDTRIFFLVEIDDVAIGMANVTRYRRMPRPGHEAGSWGYVGNVFIREEHRDAGIGAALMRHIAAWAREEGLVHLRLAPSQRSRPFYERLGFHPGAVFDSDPLEP